MVLASLSACKNPEQQAAENSRRSTSELVSKGRTALAEGKAEDAAKLFKQAAGLSPNDPMIYLLLAQAEKADGNETAAVLAIKQAEENGAKNDPSVKRERAELYRRMGQTKEAITTLSELRDENRLTDTEILMLAQLQAHEGDSDGAYQTLERVQKVRPDDPDAKAVEAEVMLAAGDEVGAAKLMDRLLQEHPQLTAARVLRARYFRQNGAPEPALADLDAIPKADQNQAEVVQLRARVLNDLKRYDESAKVLQPLVDDNPRDADLIAQLAETRLLLNQVNEAQDLIETALGIKPRFARALYVRGRAFEAQGDLKQAVENYESALQSNKTFSPALSRLWKLYDHQGRRADAIGTLERLLYMKEATLEEKIALLELLPGDREQHRSRQEDDRGPPQGEPRQRGAEAAEGEAGQDALRLERRSRGRHHHSARPPLRAAHERPGRASTLRSGARLERGPTATASSREPVR